MNRSTALFALFALLFAAAPQAAQAQTTFELGPRAGFEVNDIESFVLGGDLRVSTVALPFQLQGAFDYYFVDDDDFRGVDASVYRFTANALYEVNFGENEVFTPYFGPGISITRLSVEASDDLPGDADFDDSESDVGLNVVGGAEFEVANLGFGAVRPFVQAEFVPLGGDIQPFQVTGGLLFSLGGN